MRRGKFDRVDPRAGIIFNKMIKATEVRVTYEGNDSDIMPTHQALKQAVEDGKDLILISPKANPPVCKIVDMNKYLYEKKQRDKNAAKQARASLIENKEIRMSVNIGQNDIDVKVNKITKLLEKKCKVTLTVVLKGRERGRQDLARDLLNGIAEQLEAELEPFSVNHNRVSARIK